MVFFFFLEHFTKKKKKMNLKLSLTALSCWGVLLCGLVFLSSHSLAHESTDQAKYEILLYTNVILVPATFLCVWLIWLSINVREKERLLAMFCKKKNVTKNN